ncbi:F-box and associated interaction domains-containing protein [Euphorbia peplus]|nr:F-box and associated interaction domains-containing protein [Euphorbia peplus]
MHESILYNFRPFRKSPAAINVNTTKGDYIPDIVVEILLKLPTKSVLRFKIACKTWYSLISDPVFTNLHSKLAPQSPKILYSTPGARSRLQSLDYNSSSFDDCCLSGPISFPYCMYPKIVGSSCGLVCVDTYFYGYSFCIWNPLTREYRKLPNLTVKNYSSGYFHGFGYDSIANDFKLVISKDRIQYNIFSLKSNSWKTIRCPIATDYYHPDAVNDKPLLHGIMGRHSFAVNLNGVFHWLVALANKHPEIIAFDVGKETFLKLQLPQYLPSNLHQVRSLLEHRGRLCVSFESYRPTCALHIWMMQKEHDGWIHLLSIMNPSTFYCSDLPVLCISTRSEVVFHTSEEFNMFGREEEEKLGDDFTILPSLHKPVLYVETLVSPYTWDGLQVTAHKTKEKEELIYPLILYVLVFSILCLFLLFFL